MNFSSVSVVNCLLEFEQKHMLDPTTGRLLITPDVGVKKVKQGKVERSLIDTLVVSLRGIKPGTSFLLSLDPHWAHKFTGTVLIPYSPTQQSVTFKALDEIPFDELTLRYYMPYVTVTRLA
jgi:hypothetical protein